MEKIRIYKNFSFLDVGNGEEAYDVALQMLDWSSVAGWVSRGGSMLGTKKVRRFNRRLAVVFRMRLRVVGHLWWTVLIRPSAMFRMIESRMNKTELCLRVNISQKYVLGRVSRRRRDYHCLKRWLTIAGESDWTIRRSRNSFQVQHQGIAHCRRIRGIE